VCRFAALLVLAAAPTHAQTLTCRPGAFTGERVCQGTDAQGNKITSTSRPGAFRGETVITITTDGKTTYCVTRIGAFTGETLVACR
jgi:hypothetical protein